MTRLRRQNPQQDGIMIRPQSRATFSTASTHSGLAARKDDAAQQSKRYGQGTPSWHHDRAGDRHWITSSAVASSVSGIVRPWAWAVLSLITLSILFACWTGRSAGLAPRKPPLPHDLIAAVPHETTTSPHPPARRGRGRGQRSGAAARSSKASPPSRRTGRGPEKLMREGAEASAR
jgi:hypothetical protein